ncbi:hypothetical protein BDD12DRAFT_397982 [Trichophaea hybrida]|nr:hypothetical protein BDD12DRAFT_397982 [Trichophaea hybrida]
MYFGLLKKPLDSPTILDKCKADSLVKLLVCVQATWMVLQCISRWFNELPVTLIEFSTPIHVFYTLAMYFCCKPNKKTNFLVRYTVFISVQANDGVRVEQPFNIGQPIYIPVDKGLEQILTTEILSRNQGPIRG